MIAILSENPLLLLFIVAALGYGVGSISIGRSKLGVAAVLFVGLVFGALDESLNIPNIIFLLGLSIFVYTIGLSSGPGFFAAFERQGVRDVSFIFIMLTFSALLAVGLHFIFGFEAITTSGIFAGSNTNTPALAGLLDSITRKSESSGLSDQLELAVVGYSITYPMGVIGVMIAISLMQRILKIDYFKEAEELKKTYPVNQKIANRTIEVHREDILNFTIRDLVHQYGWNTVFGRVKRDNSTSLTNWDTTFTLGDQVAIVGMEDELDEVEQVLGKRAEHEITDESTEYDRRRIFVSNPEVAGQKIAALNISEKFSAIITRVRRGDIDIIAKGDTVLELGDRVRFVAHRKDLPALINLFGDSYQALSQINLLSFGLGMAAGLLLGMITFELPGDIQFKLGFAGGPLIVGLILGALRRSGPIVWTLPYSANLTLRQIGLIFLLATIGIRSGHTFVDTLIEGGGGLIFLTGTIISITTAVLMLLIGYKLFKIPYSILTGMVSNQPAILEYAQLQSQNQLPTFGYAIMFPISIIIKIVFVQLLYTFLS